jgi:hypothetical protein
MSDSIPLKERTEIIIDSQSFDDIFNFLIGRTSEIQVRCGAESKCKLTAITNEEICPNGNKNSIPTIRISGTPNQDITRKILGDKVITLVVIKSTTGGAKKSRKKKSRKKASRKKKSRKKKSRKKKSRKKPTESKKLVIPF